MKKTSLKLICCLTLMLCFSFSIKAQLPIKNTALTGEWKLVELNGEYESYSYDCEKKKFKMKYDMLFALGEAKADIFEKNTIKEAEMTILKLKANEDYELKLGMDSIEKGIWKSEAAEKSEEGFIPDRFGYLVFTAGSETFDVKIEIEGQQLLLAITVRSRGGGGLSQTSIFRKYFKGNAFQ